MKLAVAGMVPNTLEAIDADVSRRIAALGFTGVGFHLAGDPHEVTKSVCQQARSILADQNVRIIQFWGHYPSIISPDESIRQKGIRTAQEIIRVAADLGAPLVGIRPTSLNPRGDWWPHPDNYLPNTEKRLIASLREIAKAADQYGVKLSLECHVTSTLSSPLVVQRIVEETGAPCVKVTLDPVNFISDIPTAYNTTALVQECVERLSPYIVALHLKDVFVEDRHVVHISETMLGEGIFDLDSLLRAYEALCPDGYTFIEHLPDTQIPQAKSFLDQKLRQLNIMILE